MTYFFKHILFASILIFNIGCSKHYQIADSSSKNEEIMLLEKDSISESIILPYRKKLENQMNEVLNTSLVNMEVGSPEGLLGNFVADLTFIRAQQESDSNVDFSLLNNGGLRTPINKGEITRRNIFELMPFDNTIVIVEISGDKMIDLIEYVRMKSMMRDSRKAGVPLSGFRMMINNDVVEKVFIGAKEFDKNKTYKVATSDYLSRGGDHMDFFLNPINTENTNILLRDAIIEHITALKEKNIPINATLDGRIHHAE